MVSRADGEPNILCTSLANVDATVKILPPLRMKVVTTSTDTEPTTRDASDVAMVDPRALRFGQIVTATALTLGIVLQEPAFVLAIAVILATAVLSGWRLDLYGIVWRRVMITVLGPPEEREPASPHRFAKLMGATFTTVATVLLFAAPVIPVPSVAVAGYAIAGLVAALAAIAGIGGYCLGCKMYRQVSFFRQLGVV